MLRQSDTWVLIATISVLWQWGNPEPCFLRPLLKLWGGRSGAHFWVASKPGVKRLPCCWTTSREKLATLIVPQWPSPAPSPTLQQPILSSGTPGRQVMWTQRRQRKSAHQKKRRNTGEDPLLKGAFWSDPTPVLEATPLSFLKAEAICKAFLTYHEPDLYSHHSEVSLIFEYHNKQIKLWISITVTKDSLDMADRVLGSEVRSYQDVSNLSVCMWYLLCLLYRIFHHKTLSWRYLLTPLVWHHLSHHRERSAQNHTTERSAQNHTN